MGRNLFEDDGAIAAFRDIYFTNTDGPIAVRGSGAAAGLNKLALRYW